MSEAADRRLAAYDGCISALHRLDPKAVPVARPDEAFAIPRVAEQARQATNPAPPAPSPERMLHSRVSAMQDAVATLVAKAKRKGIPAELPSDKGDLGARLQMLNALFDSLEKKIAYHEGTTQEQQAIDELGTRIQRLEKRADAIATAMAAIKELLPHLMKAR
jgi:hypothetical protein